MMGYHLALVMATISFASWMWALSTNEHIPRLPPVSTMPREHLLLVHDRRASVGATAKWETAETALSEALDFLEYNATLGTVKLLGDSTTPHVTVGGENDTLIIQAPSTLQTCLSFAKPVNNGSSTFRLCIPDELDDDRKLTFPHTAPNANQTLAVVNYIDANNAVLEWVNMFHGAGTYGYYAVYSGSTLGYELGSGKFAENTTHVLLEADEHTFYANVGAYEVVSAAAASITGTSAAVKSGNSHVTVTDSGTGSVAVVVDAVTTTTFAAAKVTVPVTAEFNGLVTAAGSTCVVTAASAGTYTINKATQTAFIATKASGTATAAVFDLGCTYSVAPVAVCVASNNLCGAIDYVSASTTQVTITQSSAPTTGCVFSCVVIG